MVTANNIIFTFSTYLMPNPNNFTNQPKVNLFHGSASLARSPMGKYHPGVRP
jgi:hypothetical protein